MTDDDEEYDDDDDYTELHPKRQYS